MQENVSGNCAFFRNIVVKNSSNYLYKYVSAVTRFYQTRNNNKFQHNAMQNRNFGNSYFPCIIKKRNNLSLEIPKTVSYEVASI